MECTRCDRYLEEHEIQYDYIGNEWCEKCLNEESERKIDEHFKPFEDFEKAKKELFIAIDKTFKITKFASWLESKLNKKKL